LSTRAATRSKLPGLLAALWLTPALSCATLAESHAGLDNAPSARVGPFRVLHQGEIGGTAVAPFVMNDDMTFLRDASVVHASGGEFAVRAYFAAVGAGNSATYPTDRIVRFDAPDGRTFGGTGIQVLAASAPWEGGHVGAPSAIQEPTGDELFYEGAGGIGRAAPSGDGTTFVSGSEPVLEAASVPWAGGVTPKSPAAVRLTDGSYRMFFEVDLPDGAAIGEASSTDGATWTATSQGPSLAHGPPGAIDDLGVGSPAVVLATSEQGRAILYVYYTAVSESGSAIALAGRFLDGGGETLDRSATAMLAPSSALAIRKPSVVRFASVTLLFATENASKTSPNPAVIAAVAPATETLPAPM